MEIIFNIIGYIAVALMLGAVAYVVGMGFYFTYLDIKTSKSRREARMIYGR